MANFLKIPKYSNSPKGPFVYLNLDYVMYADPEAGEVTTCEGNGVYTISARLKEIWKVLLDYIDQHTVSNTI